jgi:AmiR/NasT family two-component response regulator
VRVLLGQFGGIFRVGLVDLLEEAGCEVLPDRPTSLALFERVVSEAPGVVVLDLDGHDTEKEARLLTDRFPAVTVIACSSVDLTMRVYPPFHGGESYLTKLSPDRLVRASTGA